MSARTVVYSPSSDALLTRILDGAFQEPLHEECVVVHDAQKLHERLPWAEVLVTMDSQLTDELVEAIRRAPDLRWIQLASSGFERALRHGLGRMLQVTHAPSVWGPTVAEHGVALLLALVRQLPKCVGLQAGRHWDRLAGSEGLDTLVGRNALVVGTGAIGTQVAQRLRAFDLDVTGVSRSGTARGPEDPFDRHAGVERLNALLPTADVVVLSLPLTPETTGLMGKAQFSAMKPGSYLVNVSRGAVVDTASLLAALDEGLLAGVGLDVVEPEPLDEHSRLWDRPEVLISPHVGGFSGAAGCRRLRGFVLDNIRRWERGDTPLHLIPTS